MNFLEKLNELDVETMSTEEIYESWGTTEEDFMNEMLQVVQQENQKVKASVRKAATKKAALDGKLAQRLSTLAKEITALQEELSEAKHTKAAVKRFHLHQHPLVIYLPPTKDKHGVNTLRLRVEKPKNQPSFTGIEPMRASASKPSFTIVDTGKCILIKPSRENYYSSKLKTKK